MRADAGVAARLDRRCRRLGPSGAMLRIERSGEPTGSLFCLRERADAAIAQLRKQGEENARRGHGISGRGVTALDRDVQPCGKLVEREAGEIWLHQLSEQPRVERARRAPGMPRAPAFIQQHCEVKADRVSDYDRSGKRPLEFAARLAKSPEHPSG